MNVAGDSAETLSEKTGLPLTTLARHLRGTHGGLDVDELVRIGKHYNEPVGAMIDLALKNFGGIDKLMSVEPPTNEASNLLTFERPDTTAEFEAYKGPQAAHPFEQEADAPEND